MHILSFPMQNSQAQGQWAVECLEEELSVRCDDWNCLVDTWRAGFQGDSLD